MKLIDVVVGNREMPDVSLCVRLFGCDKEI